VSFARIDAVPAQFGSISDWGEELPGAPMCTSFPAGGHHRQGLPGDARCIQEVLFMRRTLIGLLFAAGLVALVPESASAQILPWRRDPCRRGMRGGYGGYDGGGYYGGGYAGGFIDGGINAPMVGGMVAPGIGLQPGANVGVGVQPGAYGAGYGQMPQPGVGTNVGVGAGAGTNVGVNPAGVNAQGQAGVNAQGQAGAGTTGAGATGNAGAKANGTTTPPKPLPDPVKPNPDK
jgi:hypothetical protein